MPNLISTDSAMYRMMNLIRNDERIGLPAKLDPSDSISEMIQQLPEREMTGSGGSRFRAMLDSFLPSEDYTGDSPDDDGVSDWFEYTIKTGDTLSEIARLHHHQNEHNIAVDNQIKDPDSIRSGRKIRIPIPDGYSKSQIPERLDHGEQVRKPESSLLSIRDKGSEWIEHIVQPGDTIWALAVRRYHVKTEDIIRDNQIKDPRKIQPGQKLRIHIPELPPDAEVVASWYGEKFHGKPMANGDTYNMYADTIAHKDLPLGTQVELTNPSTGQKAVTVITDRGPYIEGRDVDLSFSLARKLSLLDKGVGKLVMRVLG